MPTISLAQLAVALVPAVIVVFILLKWSLQAGNAVYALLRMIGQLLLVGYFLAYIFEAESSWVILGVLVLMTIASSWIALRTAPGQRRRLYKITLLSIVVGGGIVLAVMTQLVLQIEPWYKPRFMIPLAGMVFSGSMNSVSLAAERFYSECESGAGYTAARNKAFQTSLIPITNSLFAVGVVSIPGMMTGQILSGVSPLIAVRYQIMVMCMIFAAAGISAALFLHFLKERG